MAVASLANRIQVNTNCANNDALYGPYNSIAEAISSIPSALLNGEGAVGRTIGIIENGLVIEYWWQLTKAGDTPSQNQYGFTKKGLSLEDIPEFPDVDGKIEEAIGNIEFPDYTKTFEELSGASKNNAENLNLLKDNIFNPDGSVNNNFISTMMLRVGADSMNYHMLKTKTIFNSDGTKKLTNGTLTNYSFSVLEEDTLAHFIYTDGNLNGEWKISGGYITSLNPGETYFICLKCNRNNEVGVWECSTTQHKVDEDENYWYFNWGILVYDKDGNYNLIETRGNAYMYGDNLMCGKISTLAGNSYFDLTQGDFVLGNGTGPALSYINGVLTISGSKGDAEETLRQLGILQGGVEKAQQDAEDAKNMEIGGTNLVQGTSSGYGWTGFDEYGVEDGIFYCKNINKGNDGAQIYSPKNIVLSANSDYTISFEMKASSDIRRVQFYFTNYLNSSSYESIYYTEIANKDVSTEWKKYKFNFKPTKNITSGCLRFDNDGLAGSTGNTELWLRRIKLEKGTKATDWTPAPEDYMNAIAESEDKMTEALGASVAEINGGIKALQMQVDGEVSSYFYDTAPVGIDETILTNKEPFSEWAKNYTLSNGVYVLKENARNEFVNHIGDTYTNMEEYEEDSNGNTTTPLAGLSWRWCDATTVSPLPAKYITVSYKGSNDNNITKKLHWHKIADSDAVKALQEAAKAQATADGKSTTFVAEPKNYDIGDLWILAADRTLNGKAYKQGTILTANAASATFVASHWSEKVKYIDESIAAQQAQQALDGLELGGSNLLLNSKPYDDTNWKCNNGTISFDNNVIKGQTKADWSRIYTDQFKNYTLVEGEEYTFSAMIRSNVAGKRLIFIGDSSGSVNNIRFYEGEIGTEWTRIVKTAKVINTNTSDSYFQITIPSKWSTGASTGEYIELKELKLEKGNKATAWSPAPEDVDSKADAIKAIADGAAASAKQSNDQLANMSNDNILTPQEKGSVADEWACIQKEYAQNSTNKTAAWGSATVAEWTAYNTAYTTLQTYVGTLALTDRTNNTTIVKSTFQANFANYYSANVAFLNALSKKAAELEVAAMEVGVRNLWAKKYMMDWNDTYDGTATKGSDEYGEYIAVHETNLYEYIGKNTSYNDILQGKVQFEEGKQYCLKVKWRTPINNTQWSGLYFIFEYTDGTVSESIICTKDYLTPTISTLITTKGKTVSKVRTTYGSANKTRIYEIQLVQATKQPNDWMVAPEDVDAAIEKAEGNGINLLSYQTEKWRRTTCSESSSVGTSYDNVIKGSSTTRVSLVSPIEVSGNIYVKVHNSANEVFITEFDANKLYVGKYHGWISDQVVKLSQNTKYIGVTIRNSSNTTIVLSDIKGAKVKIEKGVNQTPWSSSPEDSELEMQAATSKAEALDYLKAALTDGSTEIAGGLTMTNVLMLKNLEGFVTAGMSGLTTHNNKEDKVLMWGGGTYEEAYAAANSNTYNTGSGTITTLLKKDGTGKIGAFQIDKDTIKVVTDTQTTYITNKSIENAVGLQSTYDKAETKTTDSNSINSIDGESKSATYPSGGSKVIHTQTFYNVAAGKYLLTGEFTINSMSVGTTPVDPPSYAYSSLDLQNLYIEVWQNSKRVGYLYGNPNRQIVYEKTYQSEGNEEVLENSDTGYRGCWIQPSNGNASKTITLSAGTITIRAVAEYDAYLETEGLASASYYIDFRYLYHLQGIEKYTVIANDGIAVISNSDSQFYINNDSDSLNVKMRGLPASSTGLVTGDLYTSSGYLRIVT